MATQSMTFCVPHAEVFAAARGAASSIFQLIDREPLIDSLQHTGLAPRRVIGEITLEDVNFSYPSRPEVKVRYKGPLSTTHERALICMEMNSLIHTDHISPPSVIVWSGQ